MIAEPRWISDLLEPPPPLPPSPLSTHRPGGRLLFRFFLEPNNLTREKTLSLLDFSFAPLLLLGLPLPRQAFAFSRSLACRFWRIRELAMAAARDMILPHPPPVEPSAAVSPRESPLLPRLTGGEGGFF